MFSIINITNNNIILTQVNGVEYLAIGFELT